MYFDDWYKKQVTLRWEGRSVDLAVAQELFSSHEVDRGSLLLLRSLDVDALPERGRSLDYGCGYGVLGLAVKAIRPAWEVTLVDRDALAVTFSAWNAVHLGMAVDCRCGLDPLDSTGAGYDLVLWNVPGKAGASVLARLTGEALDVLAPAGTLALVIVHPLAETVRTAIAARDDIAIAHESKGREHTVIHARRTSGSPTGSRDGFADGIFDREAIEVVYGEIAYGLVPVIGLPQYDGPDQTSLMVMDALTSLPADDRERRRAMVVRPGVGHLPKAVQTRWPSAELVLVDRDLLALRASARALGNEDRTRTFASPDFEGVDIGAPVDLAIVMIPDQMRPPVMTRLLDDLVERIVPGGLLLASGASTEVSRFASLAAKRSAVRLRDQRKRRGSSVGIIERRDG
ncbi:MAG: methyltransferase [Thermomicrobiales bacterium]